MYTLTITGASNGVTERSIGATKGCADFNIDDLVDVGLRNYRIWGGMSRLEPQDDDGVYGWPTIDVIKAEPNVINWEAWDTQFNRPIHTIFRLGLLYNGRQSLRNAESIERQRHCSGDDPEKWTTTVNHRGPSN
jgi:hypothetical protein